MDAEQLLAQMTLEEKVGQLFLLAFAGHRLDEARLLMEQHLVGGAYISNDNIPTPEAALNLTRELQSYAFRVAHLGRATWRSARLTIRPMPIACTGSLVLSCRQLDSTPCWHPVLTVIQTPRIRS